MLKQKPRHYLLIILSFVLYAAMGYGIQRHQTLPLLACYLGIFFLFLLILYKHKSYGNDEVRFWIAGGIIFRALLLFSIPALSDDFYRFIWDGRLLNAGIHPFAQVPSYYINHHASIPGIDAELYSKLNSKETFTIYPPVSQLIFWLSVILSTGSLYWSMVVMKVIIFLFELGTLWVFSRLLRHFDRPAGTILMYALNPLVILELTGNLHFEGIMIFFLLVSISLLCRDKHLPSAFAYALSVCTKLITMIFLPLMLRHLPLRKTLSFWTLTLVFTTLLFLPLLTMDIIYGFSTSIGYYFQRFEFNASIYYLVREAGYHIFGFNIIQFAGPALAFIAASLILIISFRNLPAKVAFGIDLTIFTRMLWCMFIYLLFTTILHPWYIITLLAISIFTPYRFPVVWSCFIFFTYTGYTENGYKEKLYLVAAEYIIVIGYLFYELYGRNDKVITDYFLPQSQDR